MRRDSREWHRLADKAVMVVEELYDSEASLYRVWSAWESTGPTFELEDAAGHDIAFPATCFNRDQWAAAVFSLVPLDRLAEELDVPKHVVWSALRRIDRTPWELCDACMAPCIPVEVRGCRVCPRLCAEGDTRIVPGLTLLSWTWRLLRARLGRPPLYSEIRNACEKNDNTRKAWWKLIGPNLAVWERIERLSSKPVLIEIAPRCDAEREVLSSFVHIS